MVYDTVSFLATAVDLDAINGGRPNTNDDGEDPESLPSICQDALNIKLNFETTCMPDR